MPGNPVSTTYVVPDYIIADFKQKSSCNLRSVCTMLLTKICTRDRRIKNKATQSKRLAETINTLEEDKPRGWQSIDKHKNV